MVLQTCFSAAAPDQFCSSVLVLSALPGPKLLSWCLVHWCRTHSQPSAPGLWHASSHFTIPYPPSGALGPAQPAALLRVGTWVRLSARTRGAGVSQTNGSGPCVCSLCSRKSLAVVWKVCAGLCFHCRAAVSKPHLGMVQCCSTSVFFNSSKHGQHLMWNCL